MILATAAELLAKTTSSGDKTLVIDNDLRTIQIPSSVTCLGVENDDDVLRLNFEMSRYIGNIDLSAFAIRINYLNAKGEDDVYIVDDVLVFDNHLTFSWLVGPTATKYKGNTKFNVCMRLIDGNAYVQKEYNTTIATLPVLEGLECEESVVEYYSDVLEQWRRQLFGIGDTEEAKLVAKSEEEQQKIADKGVEVLATIPDDYITTYNLANNAYRTKANAITSTDQGETIVLTDSSDDPLRGLRIFGKTTQVNTTGKNLFDVSAALANQKRGTTAVNDYTAYGNGVRVTSNSYDHGRAYMHLTLEAGTYNISANVTVSSSWNFSVKNYDTNIELVNDTRSTAGMISYSFTLDTTALIGFCFMSVVTGGPATTATNIQLEVGSVATDYEPYSGGVASPSPECPQAFNDVNTSIEIYGRNLLGQNGEIESKYSNYTLHATIDNGVVTVSGTSMLGYGTLRTSIPLGVFKKGLTYRISRVTNNFHVGFWFYDKNNVNIGSLTTENSLAYTVPEHADHISLFYAGLTPEAEVNLTEKFMLNLGTEALPWEPCVDSQALEIVYILRGVPVYQNGNYTDSNGQQWICDEIDFERGVLVYRVVHGSFTTEIDYVGASYLDGSGVFHCYLSGYDTTSRMLSTHFRFVGHAANNSAALAQLSAGEFSYVSNPTAEAGIYFALAGITTKEEAMNWLILNRPTVYYLYKTPLKFELTSNELAAFRALHTNHLNTTILNDAAAWMEVKYNRDTETWVNNVVSEVANKPMNILIDDVTGVRYALRVSNGKLMMESV